jgi:hypothetical protein
VLPQNDELNANVGGDGEPTPLALPRAGRREWAGPAVLGLPTLLASMYLPVLHLAVPHVSADLRPSRSQLPWVVDIFGFLVAGSLLRMGTGRLDRPPSPAVDRRRDGRPGPEISRDIRPADENTAPRASTPASHAEISFGAQPGRRE